MQTDNIIRMISKKRYARLVIQWKNQENLATFYAHPINRSGITPEAAERLQSQNLIKYLTQPKNKDMYSKAIIYSNTDGSILYEYPARKPQNN